MEQFRKFLRDKAFALVLAACLLAAAAAGVWAVHTVRKELKKDLDAVRSPSSTAPGIDEGIRTSPGLAGEEEAEWQQQTAPAANSVANVPEARSSSGGAASSSGAQSGSGSVREPSALQTESSPASSSAAPASTQPVSVSAGQTIGKVGSVSCECAEESHIHLEVMQDGRYLDPVKAMK